MSTIKRIQLLNVLFFAIPFFAGISYLLAFYPGMVTNDSYAQWDQASRFTISNWHPAYHTLLIWLLSRVYYSPAAVAFFQVLVFSLVVAYGLLAFRQLGVPAWLLLVLDGVVSLIPINGLMEITLWKDVLYSISVLLLSIYLLKIITSRGAWLACGANSLWLGLDAANVSLLRHNGFPVAFGVLLIVLVVYSWRKQSLLALLVALGYVLLVTGPLYRVIKVDLASSQSPGVALIHPIAAHVSAGASFSPEETAYLNRIYPLEKGWNYNCYEATALFYTGVNFAPVQQDPLYAARLLGRLTLERPMVTVRHFACLSSFVWQLSQPKGIYLETLVTTSQSLDPYPQWQQYAQYFKLSTQFPHFRKLVIKAFSGYTERDPGMIALRPAMYLYLLTAAVLLYAYRLKSLPALLILVPALLQSVVMAFFMQAQALRYQYPVYLIGMLFAVPLFYLAVRSRKFIGR